MPQNNSRAMTRLTMLAAMARAQGAAGELQASRETLEELLGLLPESLPGLRAQLVVFIAGIDHLLGHHADAEARILDALDGLANPGSDEGAQLKLQLASARFFAADFDRARSWTAAAVEAARANNDRAFLAATVAHMAFAEYHLGRIREARAAADEAHQRVAALGDAELSPHVYALMSLGWADFGLERYADATRTLERGLRLTREYGQNHLFVPFMLSLGWVACEHGRLAEALDHAETAGESAALSASAQFACWAATNACWAHTRSGDLDAALAEGERALALAEEVDENMLTALSGCVLAEARLEAGEPEAARELLLATAGGEELPLLERPLRPFWWEVLARAALALGDNAAAESFVVRAERVGADLDLAGRGSGSARLARARLLLAREAHDDAAAGALQAAGDFATAGWPIEEGRARIVAGVALGAAGRGPTAGASSSGPTPRWKRAARSAGATRQRTHCGGSAGASPAPARPRPPATATATPT